MKKLLAVFVSLLSPLTASNAVADNVNVGASLTIPPYIIAETKSGMEVEIVREALIQSSHEMELSFIPLKRVYESIRGKKTDAGMTVMKTGEHSDLFFSESHITYQNVAISLKSRNLKINSISDLKDFSLMAFQNAPEYLGPDFSQVSKTNKNYSEKANQDVQIAMLFSGKVDVIVLDINIFKNLRRQESRVDTSADVVIHELFPKNDMRVAFNNESLRDDFNLGLNKIKENGAYKKIVDKYTN